MSYKLKGTELAKMDVMVNTWGGAKRMKLADALTPEVNRQNPNEQALALAKQNAKMLGAMAAAMVEKGIWTLPEAAAACGQCGIMQVIPAPAATPAPTPAPMSSEWKPKV